MITQLDRLCWTASPGSDYRHYPGEPQALAAVLPGGVPHVPAALGSPCWTASCDHPGCGIPFPGPSQVLGAVAHAPDEAAIRAWMPDARWACRADGGTWCPLHQADKGILEAAAEVAVLAGYFACVSRAVVTVADGSAESDSDHTVCLAWLAPALAAATEPGLDPNLIAAYAAVHDAVEVFAGDTPRSRSATPNAPGSTSARKPPGSPGTTPSTRSCPGSRP